MYIQTSLAATSGARSNTDATATVANRRNGILYSAAFFFALSLIQHSSGLLWGIRSFYGWEIC